MDIVHNIMEDLVEIKLNEQLVKVDCCKCDICRADMMAYALNHIKPKYVTTRIGSLYAKVDNSNTQVETDVLRAVIEAINVVSAHPRHQI